MIRRTINIDCYWKVIVYYNVDYNFFNYIAQDINNKRISKLVYKELYNNKAKAVTISNHDNKTSIVCFNKHISYWDYINSIIHEAEHIKQHILEYYEVEDSGEEPAYTIGYIAMKMLMKF